MSKKTLSIKLANLRGFCAGVDRAIRIVEKTLEKYGAPVFVRHEIVHNKFVVESLRDKGAVFVEELNEIPVDQRDRPAIFSAHGVSKQVEDQAKGYNLHVLDATCPLVDNVHRQAQVYHQRGYQMIMIGHKGHPEVIGTMGQVPDGVVILIENADDVENITVPDENMVAYITQTTLSLDETAQTIEALKKRFPNIKESRRKDICYATTNRQTAVKAIAPIVDAMLIVGGANSSNTNRLVDAAKVAGCEKAIRIENIAELDIKWLSDVDTIGISSGASVPDILVQEVLTTLAEWFDTDIEEIQTEEENMEFALPSELEKDKVA